MSAAALFLRAHLRSSPDSRARIAYCLNRDGSSLAHIARKLRVPLAEVPCLIALGRRLLPARRR